AGVCMLSEAANEEWMQLVAREMNLSETAFLHPEKDGYRLRWFTPTVEVDLCGHATLASAHILWETESSPRNTEIHFYTNSGLLKAYWDDPWIRMDFPNEAAEDATIPKDLTAALGDSPFYTARNRFGYLVVFDNESIVRQMEPDFSLLKKVPPGVAMVTAPADSQEFDFVSRCFVPALGINEDPVTGSAHCCLGPYWSEQLGKTKLMAYQASRRGGIVAVEVQGDRIMLGGQAVTVMKIEMF
ncbi:PhzF family phenazine biosynthesis protein, partial [Candidatus Neomarinimicrobiota bacterium]